MKKCFGVGYNSGATTSYPSGKMFKEYRLWYHMLERSYCKKYQSRKPTYFGCVVSENFKDFAYFKNWCKNQVGFDESGFSLDKDLLIKGNKIYSEDTCVFIPLEVNNALTNRKSCRGNCPVGVTANNYNNLFSSKVRRGNIATILGSKFKTPTEAFLVYKDAKEDYLRFLANKYKNQIDKRAYEALLEYQISITD